MNREGASLSATVVAAGINPLIVRTYDILLAAIAGIALVAVASYFWLPARFTPPVATAAGAAWVLCAWIGLRKPVALVLPLFCVCNGMGAGLLAQHYPDIMVSAAILTIAAFASLTVYVHVTNQDFSFLQPFVWCASVVLVIGGVFVAWSHRRRDHIAFAVIGTLVWLYYIVSDTGDVVDRAEVELLTPGPAAFTLLLDVVQLQGWLFDLILSFLRKE